MEFSRSDTFLLLLVFSCFFPFLTKAGLVPALYVFGDSLVDCGNNNFLNTGAKGNRPPNGIDFPGGLSTGRFSNGFLVPDFFGKFTVGESFFLFLLSRKINNKRSGNGIQCSPVHGVTIDPSHTRMQPKLPEQPQGFQFRVGVFRHPSRDGFGNENPHPFLLIPLSVWNHK